MLTRAAVVGSPVGHSLSPVLHRAAYASLGLTDWTYDRVDVARGALAGHVGRLGPEWAGLSVTMPGKEEALALAATATEEARSAGAANTLVRRQAGWHAENTDVPGLAAAIRETGLDRAERAVVLGGGATARSAILALHSMGAAQVTVCVRDDVRRPTRDLLERLRLDTRIRLLADGIPLGDGEVVVSTLPGDVPSPSLRPPAAGADLPVLVDTCYLPWPSAFSASVGSELAGRVAVVRGTRMLLHQAAHQVELMTGRPAPVAAMDDALSAHLATEGA
ncbi:shikimate dehydrogenase [Serinicoccus kebangsaanensis]|uniref:shikimate dehydrogenase n=1 Tax=Serinicoccus kebangsaanensis TaxID=2602069 RepID=UPI00124CF49A|nr:shikimate dehydrogenase [Serinicoccus kebangsaanensis]